MSGAASLTPTATVLQAQERSGRHAMLLASLYKEIAQAIGERVSRPDLHGHVPAHVGLQREEVHAISRAGVVELSSLEEGGHDVRTLARIVHIG